MPIIVSNVYPPDRGGIQTMMASLADVAAAETDVVVVAPAMAGSAAFDRSKGYRAIRFLDLRRPANAVTLTIAFVKALTIARDRTTLAANWWPSGLPLAIMPRFLRGKLAIFAHGSDVAPERGGLRKAAMRYVFSRADVIFANSRFTEGLLAKAGVTNRVRIIALGVDADPIEPNPSSVPTVLSVGRLVERKGFDRIIEALVQLRRLYPNIRYEIVGDGPHRGRLEALAEHFGVADCVVFHGALLQRDMRLAYARAWCFALPVREVGNDVEGFGIVYLEAAMASLPAVGGLRSGAADAIVEGETGFLVDGNDPEAVGTAIAKLLSDPGRARQMGARAFERAKTFTWQRTYETIKLALRA